MYSLALGDIVRIKEGLRFTQNTFTCSWKRFKSGNSFFALGDEETKF